MRCFLLLAFCCLRLAAQVVEESFARDPGPLDFVKGEGHEQAIVQSLAGDALVGMDARGRTVPRLAERWEAKGARLVFHLRKDARFADGAPVQAEDAVWTLQAIQADPAASPTKRAILRGVRAKGRGHLLELESDRPAERLLLELPRVPIARRGLPGMGSGPFLLAHANGEWRFTARSHFLKPSIPGLRFRLIGEEQAVLQNLQKGWLHIGVPPPRRGLQAPPSHVELGFDARAQLIVWSRMGLAPLKALEGWRGEAFPSDFFGGRAFPSLGLLPEGLGFRPRMITGQGGAVRGQRWELLYTAGDDVVEKALLALRERAKREGVTLDPRPVEASLLFERLQKGDFQLACAINVFDPHPWSALDLMVPKDGMNFARWGDPAFEALLPRLGAADSPAWEQLQALWAAQPTSLPLLDFRGVVWVDRRLKVQPGPLGLYLGTPGAAGWSWSP